MSQFSKLKPDGASSVFTLDEVYDQMRRLPDYLEQQTPSTIPGVVAAIVGFELLRRARARPKDGQ